MKIIEINSNKKNYIFKPSLSEEVTQNVENVVSRIRGNVVLARHKGKIAESVDLPAEIVKAKISSEILEEVSKEEPRFSIGEITVSNVQEDVNIKIKGVINGKS